MAVEIVIPRLGWTMESGIFLRWLKQEGELVQPGEPLFELEGEKAIQEVEATDGGILRISPHAPQSGASASNSLRRSSTFRSVPSWAWGRFAANRSCEMTRSCPRIDCRSR